MLTTVCSLTVGKMLLILVQVQLTEDNPSSWFWSSESSSSKYTNNFVWSLFFMYKKEESSWTIIHQSLHGAPSPSAHAHWCPLSSAFEPLLFRDGVLCMPRPLYGRACRIRVGPLDTGWGQQRVHVGYLTPCKWDPCAIDRRLPWGGDVLMTQLGFCFPVPQDKSRGYQLCKLSSMAVLCVSMTSFAWAGQVGMCHASFFE